MYLEVGVGLLEVGVVLIEVDVGLLEVGVGILEGSILSSGFVGQRITYHEYNILHSQRQYNTLHSQRQLEHKRRTEKIGK